MENLFSMSMLRIISPFATCLWRFFIIFPICFLRCTVRAIVLSCTRDATIARWHDSDDTMVIVRWHDGDDTIARWRWRDDTMTRWWWRDITSRHLHRAITIVSSCHHHRAIILSCYRTIVPSPSCHRAIVIVSSCHRHRAIVSSP